MIAALAREPPGAVRSTGTPPALSSRWAHTLRGLSRRRRPLGVAFSLATHVAILLALVLVRPEPPKTFDAQIMSLQLAELPPPTPPAEPVDAPVPDKPQPSKAPPRKSPFRETRAPTPRAEPLPAGEDDTVAEGVDVSDAELAGAATAGSGPAGGACNMPRLLQNALRKDPQVQAAVASAHRGKAIRVWNGDWVRHSGQEGAGLAALREAMMWEIGFAPEACRKQAVHGLVMISLNDSPGSARLVLGSGSWRWSDLLF